jgi:hypothetical protein
MEKKFIKLLEATLSRYTRGGFLTSDRVLFAKDALKHDFFKDQPETVKKAVEELINSGVNLRVRNVKSFMPAVMGAGNPDNYGYSFNIEVVPEIAPGTYDVNKSVTVPANLLVHQNDGINLPPVPNSLKYDNKVKIEPTEANEYLKDAAKGPFNPVTQTHTSDLGNKKTSTGDRALKNKNTVIPSSPAVGHKDPASYTAQYLPKS